MRVLFIGEINPDLILLDYASFPIPGREVLVENARLVMGSASAICACAMARLGNEVVFFGKVGCDSWGDFCLDQMNAAGIDISRVIRDPDVQTGITVSISSSTDRALITRLGSIAALREEEIPDDLFEGAVHLHLSSYYMQTGLRPGCPRLLERAARAGLSCSLDPGCDPTGQWDTAIYQSIQRSDLFFPNEAELRGITGLRESEAALRSLQNPRTLTIAKLGAAGCMALVNGGTLRVAPPRVEPYDTTGAGDCFNAAFLHFWLRRRPIEEALQFAAVYGALSTLGLGGTGNLLCYEEAEFIWQQHVQQSA